jgi:hypothetical protein
MTNTPGGGAIVQYAQGQDGQFFVPGWLRLFTMEIPPRPPVRPVLDYTFYLFFCLQNLYYHFHIF